MTDEPKLELEEQWSREKAAKQEAGRRPPHKPKNLGAIVAVVLLLGAVGAGVALYLGTSASEPESASDPRSADRVRVEIRSRPVAAIRISGTSYGNTPVSIQVPRSTKELVIEATIVVVKYSLTGREVRDTHELKQVVIPDRDRTVDFKL